MTKFKLKGINYKEFHKLIQDVFKPESRYIEISVAKGVGERLYEDIYADIDLPRKDIAFYDGYAVSFNDISHASPSRPVKLRIVAKILRDGDEEGIKINPGEAAYVSANSPIPDGADTLVRSELTRVEGDYVVVRKAVKPGSDIVHKGEDLRKGDLILRKGKLLEGQDITLLTEIGYTRIKVFRKPFIAIFSVGDELRDMMKEGAAYPDNYRFAISYMAREMGCETRYLGILSDDPEHISTVVDAVAHDFDAILLIGGASIGLNDKTGPALTRVGEPIFHGTTLSPGKVSGIYIVRDRPVFLVPGHIGSAVACLYYIFYPYIKHVYYDGIDTLPHVKGVFKVKPDQRPGKHTVRTVSIERGMNGELMVIPHHRRLGGSTLLTLLTEGAGLILMEPDREYNIGDEIEVRLFSNKSIYKIKYVD